MEKMMLKLRVQQELEGMRQALHDFFGNDMRSLAETLLAYADELDESNKSKMIKTAVGGILAVIAYGLSVVTSTRSLGLHIAGEMVVRGAQFVMAEEGAIIKVKQQLETYQEATNEVLKKCQHVALDLKRLGDIEDTFPFWLKFWSSFIFGSDQAASGIGWEFIAGTINKIVCDGDDTNITGRVAGGTPIARTLVGTANGLHIAGNVSSIVFIPVDLYRLVSESTELHSGTAHDNATRIRETVREIKNKSFGREEVDNMIDKSMMRSAGM